MSKTLKPFVSIVLVTLMLITVSAAADTGSIGVRSTPDHADVYIDGKLLCTGCTEKYNSQFFKGISVGYHTVTVKKSGYVDWSKSVYVSKAGGFAFSSANLEPVSAETPAPTITAVPSTPTPTPTPTPTLTPIHTPTPLPTPTPVVIPPVTPTPSPSSTPAPPGFEAIFTIAGLLAVAYLLRRRD